MLLNNADFYAWNTQGGRLRYLQSGTYASQTSLQNFEYSYDDVGNISWIKDYRAGSPQLQTFGYDNLDRLTCAGATGETGGNGDYSESCNYKAASGTLTVITDIDSGNRHGLYVGLVGRLSREKTVVLSLPAQLATKTPLQQGEGAAASLPTG